MSVVVGLAVIPTTHNLAFKCRALSLPTYLPLWRERNNYLGRSEANSASADRPALTSRSEELQTDVSFETTMGWAPVSQYLIGQLGQ